MARAGRRRWCPQQPTPAPARESRARPRTSGGSGRHERATGHRSGRDPGMARLPRRRDRGRGPGPRRLPPRRAARPRAPARHAGAVLGEHALPQHHPARAQARHPGDRAIEHRIRSSIRWNALAIVLRANKESSELGGHIASFQSAATLYDTGFMHFWHAPTESHGGDLDLRAGPLLARHLRPRLPRGPAHRGAAARTSARRSTARASPPIRIPG